MPDDWEETKAKVIIRENFRCYRCEKKKKLSVHHLIPRAEGGGNNIENLIALCLSCHDEVEIAGYRTRAEISASYDLETKELPEKETSPREETFTRPAWHAYVYGGKRHSE